jgi:hypothetical protein
VVLHVLNYDYDPELDQFQTQYNLSFQVDPSAFGFTPEDTIRCRAYTATRDVPLELPCDQTDGYMHISLPELNMYELVVLRSSL